MQILEDLNECKEQLLKQFNRLRELRIKKVEEPGRLLSLMIVYAAANENLFRCVLRGGRHKSARCRCDDGRVDGSHYFYSIYDRSIHRFADLQVRLFFHFTVVCSLGKPHRRSSRSKRKLERKVGSGRKGTVDEEEYLLKSLTKLTARFATIQSKPYELAPPNSNSFFDLQVKQVSFYPTYSSSRRSIVMTARTCSDAWQSSRRN